MKKCFLNFFAVLLLLLLFNFSSVNAQERANDGYNPHSVYPIHESDIMYKKEIWRRVDLKEKQNKSFFATNMEITRVIIEAVKAGLIFPYENDSLTTRMSKEVFLENLKLPDEGGGLTEEEKAMGFGGDDDWGSDWGDEGDDGFDDDYIAEFSPRDFSILEVKEDMIFDRRRARMYYDIQSITIVLPADKNPALFERPLASFRYKDLAALFKELGDEAVWYNVQNQQQHRNLSDAFDLRLFTGHIIKYSNPEDERIVEIYSKSRKAGIIASQEIEYQLMEFEHELWEF